MKKKNVFVCSKTLIVLFFNLLIITAYSQQDSLVDGNGRVYPVTKIGNQVWMTQNLAYYMPGKTRGVTFDKDDLQDTNKVGYYYTYNAAMNACPTGWHLPSDDEWKQLEIYLGMKESITKKKKKYRGEPVGAKLKSTEGWKNSTNGTNESGFNAVPAGWAGTIIYDRETVVCFWTATRVDDMDVWVRKLGTGDGVYRGKFTDFSRISVRCVKDKE